MTLEFDLHAVERLWNDSVNSSGADLPRSYCLLPWPQYLPFVPLRDLEPVSSIPVIRVFLNRVIYCHGLGINHAAHRKILERVQSIPVAWTSQCDAI
jgi:hypothetical protein